MLFSLPFTFQPNLDDLYVSPPKLLSLLEGQGGTVWTGMPSAPRYKKRQCKISLLPIFKFSYIINEGKQAFPASTIPNQLKQTVTIYCSAP